MTTQAPIARPSARKRAPDSALHQAIAAGRVTFGEPIEQAGGKALVRITDTETGEQVDKVFTSAARASDWVAAMQLGLDVEDPLEDAAPQVESRSTFREVLPTVQVSRRESTKAAQRGKISIRSVRAVLEDYGMDPTAEICKAVQEMRQLHIGGKPQFEADGVTPKMVPVLDAVERARLMVELQQYVTPKLKAVEMRVKDERDGWTPEMVDDKILAKFAAILGQAMKAQGGQGAAG